MEVESERLVRDIQLFSNFLKVATFSHGGLINYSNIGRDCGTSPNTVMSYFDLLEDLLLGFRLTVFLKRARRELVHAQKFYFFDAGVFTALRPKGPLDAPSEIFGQALEGLVIQHLRAWIQYRMNGEEVFFWRSRGGVEVDFVVYGEEVFTAIEVKRSNTIRSDDLSSLKEFAKDYAESTRVLLYGGTTKLFRDGIWCLPVDAFLRALHPARNLAEIIEGV